MASKRFNNVLITGITGLLGHEVASQLISLGTNVVGLVKTMPVEKIKGAHYIECDFNLDVNLSEVLKGLEFDVIFHLAQSRKFRNFPNMANDVFAVNIKSTAILLDYAYRNSIPNFVYTSSGGIYQASGHRLSENSHLLPVSKLGFYLGSKIASETLVSSYREFLNVKIVRPFFIYGPRQHEGMLIKRLINNIENKKKIILNGSSGIKINPIFVVDAAEATIEVINNSDVLTVNVAGKEDFTIRQISEIIGDLLDKNVIYEQSDVEVSDMVADISMQRLFITRPMVTLREGLIKTIGGTR